MRDAVPVVEVADQADRACRRGPDGEGGAGDALVLSNVCTQQLIELLVSTLADQMQVELPERRRERVRIGLGERAGRAVVDLELVAKRQLGALDHALEDACLIDLPQRCVVVGQGVWRPQDRDHADRTRAQRADHHAVWHRVGPEDRVRVGGSRRSSGPS